MSVEVKIADDRREYAFAGESVANVRHCGRGLIRVDGDAHEF